MGPIEGAIYADALTKALPSQIQSINAIQSEIDQIGESLGISFAEKFAGDELRNAQMGKQIAQGILDGLKAEQARLEAQMTSLGNAMAEAFKRALGIRSPSMVFKKLGSQTMQGLQIGIERETGGVIGALPRLDQSFSTIPGRVPHASVNAPSAHPAQAGPMVNIERVEVHEQVSMQVLTHRLDGWVRQAGRLR